MWFLFRLCSHLVHGCWPLRGLHAALLHNGSMTGAIKLELGLPPRIHQISRSCAGILQIPRSWAEGS